ncbi:MAG: hypothetical protein F6K09_13170 [Merismopedia sp. SIO2A8]|nr:hypothetical protein [Merismopedia sp. SIO2A8]
MVVARPVVTHGIVAKIKKTLRHSCQRGVARSPPNPSMLQLSSLHRDV